MSSNFKLLMTTDVTSGVWNYTITLCESLIKQINAEILLVSFGGKPRKNQIEEANNLNIKTIFTDYPSEWQENNLSELASIKEIREYLKHITGEFEPNLIHINNVLYSSNFENYPKIAVVHNDALNWIKWVKNKGNNYTLPEHLANYRDKILQSLNNVDVVVAPSRFMAESLVRMYDYRKNLQIIYNGISYEISNEMPENPNIVTVGRLWDRAKNFDLLLKIASKLPNNIKIYAAGEPYADRATAKRIEYLGNLSMHELRKVYNKSSIYLALSVYEPFGLPPVEAAYSNCAIVANDIPTYRELWGDCGCLFERNNINSLIRTINNLIENEQLLQHIAKNCQAKAISAFNSKRMGLEYINLYKNVLQKNYSFSRK